MINLISQVRQANPTNWYCYLIYFNNKTYIGSTNNFPKRLKNHNTGKGAKRTHGNVWIPAIVLEGFGSKESCLSFETCWKRLYYNRSQCKCRLRAINLIKGTNYMYGKDGVDNRLLDLMVYAWFNYLFYRVIVRDQVNLILPANFVIISSSKLT